MKFKVIYSRLKKIKQFISLIFRINWSKSIYFNFKMLPIKSALKLPVLFYGKVKFTSLSGKFLLNFTPKFGLVKFGNNLEIIKRNFNKAEIRIDGTFCLNGSLSTGNDYLICVTQNGYLEIGEGAYLGFLTKIIATNYIRIGKGFGLAAESQIIDSNFHYSIDKDTNKVSRYSGAINISNNCWVGFRTTIMKGTITPSNIIIASNSLLNKDYTLTIPENAVIGGMPAKLIKTNTIPIFNSRLDQNISRYFQENPHETYYQLKTDDNYSPDYCF